jgi:hypothetical protein
MVDLMILLAQGLSILVLVSGAYVACRYLREDLREGEPAARSGTGDAASASARALEKESQDV